MIGAGLQVDTGMCTMQLSFTLGVGLSVLGTDELRKFLGFIEFTGCTGHCRVVALDEGALDIGHWCALGIARLVHWAELVHWMRVRWTVDT
eukprot:scaffold96737_cov18-Tisochrysis_lutea.AAC.3